VNKYGVFKCLCPAGITGMLCDLGIVYPRHKRTVNPWQDEVNRAKLARRKLTIFFSVCCLTMAHYKLFSSLRRY